MVEPSEAINPLRPLWPVRPGRKERLKEPAPASPHRERQQDDRRDEDADREHIDEYA